MAQKKQALGRGIESIYADNTIEDKGGVTMVRIGEVEPNSAQPRKSFDSSELEALSESISQYGVIQPVTVRQIDGMYQIITGERRWRAARMAGLSEIPVIVITADDRKAAELALVENIQRSDLNPIEEAKGYASLIDEYGLTQEETAKRLGKSRTAITNALRLLNLPEGVLHLIETGELSTGHAKVLLGINDPEKREPAAKQVVAKGLSVRDTEKLVKLYNLPPKEDVQIVRDVDHTRNLELALQKHLGRTVKITEKGKARSVSIGYSDNEDLEALLRLLCGDTFVGNL